MNRVQVIGVTGIVSGITALGTLALRVPVEQSEPAAGFARERVARLEQLIQRHVNERRLPGAVLLLARRGHIATLRAFGAADLESRRPMRSDSLFRLASAAKIVTSAGLLALYEDGRFGLGDPVGDYLPELRALNVQAPGGKISAATRPLTIRDLLRHTSGYGYGNDERQRSAYRGAQVMRPGPESDWSHDFTLEQWLGRLATVPLVTEPGTRFEYGLGSDVAGALIERLAGKPLDEFLHERIFGPLRMKDTGFAVDDEQQRRLTSVYLVQGTRLEQLENADRSPFRRRPKALSGGGGWDMLGNGGLVSTAPDMFRFLQMLLNGGVLDKTRVLSRHSVEMMFTNQLAGLAVPERSPGVGFGFGYAIVTDSVRYGESASDGLMWWAGSTNTRYWLDPHDQLVGLYLTQVQPFPYMDLMNVVMRLSIQALE